MVVLCGDCTGMSWWNVVFVVDVVVECGIVVDVVVECGICGEKCGICGVCGGRMWYLWWRHVVFVVVECGICGGGM